jgi:hypothetical protein
MSLIKVKRIKDGRIFTSDMSGKDDACILQIHFSTSYTQVVIQEKIGEKFTQFDLICLPIGSEPCVIDLIATANDDEGVIL